MYYSPWKAVHHMDKLEQLRSSKMITPVLLKIIPTNRCNRKCHFCWEAEANQQYKETLETEIIMKLLKDFGDLGGKAVELAGGGEPTVHPDFKLIIDTIREMGFELGMPTNGLGLSEDIIDSMSFATWIRVSVNAYSKEVYKEVSKVEPPSEDMYRLLCKKVQGVVGASFVITEKNYHEILDFAIWAKDIGFDHVRFTPFRLGNRISQSLTDIWNKCEQSMEEAEKLSDDNFRVITIANRYVAKEGLVQPIHYLDTAVKDFDCCHLQQFNACVWTTGDVLPCVENRINMETSYGNLYEKSFKEIWENRQLLDVKECKLSCLYYNTNKFLSYLTQQQPPHVNFV